MRKKLLYTAPRLLRAAVRSAVNATFTALPAARRAEHGGDVLRYMNASLSILDLGCGTGLCGSWMESYANEFVGVDIRYELLTNLNVCCGCCGESCCCYDLPVV
jgi:2-polyprenyl-3-methyl-5-hydroxy-6-metoxy-1,4-benzoquinol methylase